MFFLVHVKSCSTKATVQQDMGRLSGDQRLLGQPTPASHPHIMKNGELMPGISISEFHNRRSFFASSLRHQASQHFKDAENHLVVIPAAPQAYMSQKVPYVYRQNSDFLYLTGCLETESVLVMIIPQNSSDHRTIMFVRERNAHSELWDGPRTGVHEAPKLFDIDEAFPVEHLNQYLAAHAKTTPGFMLWYDFRQPIDLKVHQILSSFVSDVAQSVAKMWMSPRKLVHELRVIKSPAEQVLMRKSCQIASKAIETTIASSHPGISEHELFATVDYHSRMNGAEYLAYLPVVAGGERANIIHYINNSQIINDGELVLMDAGCEYHSYSSDITRTWPVSGKFSPKQREVYEALLSVQVELISLLSKHPSLDSLFSSMCQLLAVRLREIGLISSKITSKQDLSQAAYAFCPHHVSHYLGMDVHDTELVERKIPVTPGMVVTVEPGIYIKKDNMNVDPELRGMGMRIEDDVLITESGVENMTAMCAKYPDQIENLFKQRLSRKLV
ncbi:Xaa-Pro aminopeptidase 3 [Frankliniella fusca]|uniref:Xaa-Pro aminopeptidase 3 n=1 Tax=Frankliniella fusca TaxID=407009 RepID=A0AAE1LHW0_9NEOP|nr:Xaa-Pro aminopeptidase 3 [Frankliniella fusca]